MSVALLSPEYPPLRGGIGDYTARLAAALRASGCAVRVLTSRAAVRRAWAEGAGPGSDVLGVAGRWGWSSIARIAAAAGGCHALHVQYQTAAYGMHPAVSALPLRLRQRRPDLRLVTTFHDLLPPYLFPGAGPLRHLPAALLAAASHRVVLTAPQSADAPPLRLLRRLAPRVLSKLRLVPIGSNLPEDAPPDYDRATWRRRLGVGLGEPLLGFFGFQHPSKGLDTVWHALVQPALRDVRLVLVGAPAGASDATSTAHAAQLDRLAAALGIGERVVRTGCVPPAEAAAYLLAADLVVLPFSDGASFQRGSLVAALALGLPLLTTARPNPPAPPGRGEGATRRRGEEETRATLLASSPHRRVSASLLVEGSTDGADAFPSLVHGTHAWLVPPGDATALAGAARALLDDPLRRAELGAGARDLARFFRWERIAAAHLALYRELAEEAEG